jgi:integrase/recombinase XerD
MKSSELIGQYLSARRANGTRIKTGQRLLYQFARETGDLPLAAVTPQAISAFLRGHGELTATWRTRCGVLTGLYRFAMARGHVEAWPLPDQPPKLPPQLTPYVYSRDELQRLLDATDSLTSPWSRLQAPTYRALLLLLYATGLRVSEALRLRLTDLDRAQRMLIVRETKFYKTRLVPVGEAANRALVRYVERRCNELPVPEGVSSALFASRSGHRLDYQRVVTLFQKIRAQAGIGCPPGERRPPRLHDLRHTAAVHRVVSWYQDGKDVQLLLPRLATYLGHASIASTQRYLRMTPELLHQASMRFAQYADLNADEEDGDA